MVSQVLNQQRYLTVYILRQVNSLLVRQKLDAVFQDALKRWRILQRAPVDIRKFILDLLCQLRSKRRLADPTDAQHCYYLAMLIHNPLL